MNKLKGFTFIELILYTAIVSTVLGSVIPFAISVIQGSAKSEIRDQVNTSASLISAFISSRIKNATGINLTGSNFGTNLAADPSALFTLDITASLIHLFSLACIVVANRVEANTMTSGIFSFRRQSDAQPERGSTG